MKLLKTLRQQLWDYYREPVMFMAIAIARLQFGYPKLLPIWVAWVFLVAAFLMLYALYVGAIFSGRRTLPADPGIQDTEG